MNKNKETKLEQNEYDEDDIIIINETDLFK